jgi:hypothetical protein
VCGWKLVSPEYAAERVSVPKTRFEVLIVTVPFTSVAEPTAELPLFNVTVPLGTIPLDALADTLIVNATDCP